jgi:hypothetical protein
MSTRRTTNVGAKLDARFNPTEQPGIVAGVQGQMVSKLDAACPCMQTRGLASFGYSSAPERTSASFVGVEFLTLVGFGRMPSASGALASGLIAGGQVVLPIRLAKRSELWDADEYVGTRVELAPDVTLLGFSPTSGANRSALGEVSVGLSLRFHQYSAVLP